MAPACQTRGINDKSYVTRGRLVALRVKPIYGVVIINQKVPNETQRPRRPNSQIENSTAPHHKLR